MKSFTLRMALALVAALAIAACSDDSPTSPTASSGAGPSALADGNGSQLEGAHHRPGHGGGGGPGEDPPDPVYTVTAIGDVTMSADAGGSGGTVNIRATDTLAFSGGFIDQGAFTNGAACFPSQTLEVSGGIMNPSTHVAGAAAGVQIYFTATNTATPPVDVKYSFLGEVGFPPGCTLADDVTPCSFPPPPTETVTTEWIGLGLIQFRRRFC